MTTIAPSSRQEKVYDIQSLTAQVNLLSAKVGWWNSAIVVMMIVAALAATGLLVTQFIAFKRAGQLAIVQADLSRAKDAKLSGELKDKDGQIANLNLKAKASEAGIAVANANAAEANLKAAKANARASEANLALAKFRAPRTLNPEQQGKIAEAIRVFAGKQFDVALNIEPEPQFLLPQIEDTLKAAGWVEIDWKGNGGGDTEINFVRTGRTTAGIVIISGVLIQMRREDVPELWQAAQALTSALNAEGIAAKAQPGLGFPNTNTKAIHIMVGKKPQ